MSTPVPDRAPVVALHSLFFGGKMFDSLRVRSGRTLLAPDHRGQGVRLGDPEVPTIERLAADAEQAIEQLGQPVHLVGSSMGAYVSMVVAARSPCLVRSCTLSAATADAEQRPEMFAALVEDLRTTGPADMVDRIASTMFGYTFVATPSAALNHWREHFARLDRSVADAAEQVFGRSDLWAEVESIRAPILLLAGREDRAKSPADMQSIADRTGCAAPVVFERSGHTPFIEQPVEVAEVLDRFWSSIEIERKS